jgi:hypothetical protein
MLAHAPSENNNSKVDLPSMPFITIFLSLIRWAGRDLQPALGALFDLRVITLRVFAVIPVVGL